MESGEKVSAKQNRFNTGRRIPKSCHPDGYTQSSKRHCTLLAILFKWKKKTLFSLIVLDISSSLSSLSNLSKQNI